jgi:hypothetical protein
LELTFPGKKLKISTKFIKKKTVASFATGRYLVPNSDMQPVILRLHVQSVSHYNTHATFSAAVVTKHFSLNEYHFFVKGQHTAYATKSKSANVRSGLESYGV